MNKLDTAKRALILTSLVEGNSIASTCRMFGVNKVTVLRLLADAGTVAQQFHDTSVRNLSTKRVQVDEIWSFIGSKHSNVRPENWGKQQGDCWCWVALDADSKLVTNWYVGGREGAAARSFVYDLADRLTDRIQLTSDGWSAYRDAVKKAFGDDIDYAMLVKEYATETPGYARYSPPRVISCAANVITGNPIRKHINTSFIERQNLSMRMGMRRFTRLTNGFSKKIENHKHMIALYYFHYNWVRVHMTRGTTPAISAGLTDRQFTMEDFVGLVELQEKKSGARVTNYKPASKWRPN